MELKIESHQVLLTQSRMQGIENIEYFKARDHVNCAHVLWPSSIPQHGRGGQRKNYTEEELNQLCYSQLHVSQDPAIGNGQQAKKFWDRVEQHYNHHRPAECEFRAKKSLEGKWAEIKHDVSKFIGCYQQIESRQISGKNDDDTLKTARELYRENHPKSKNFSYESAWAILKDPRWHTPADEMARTKNTVRVKGNCGSGSLKDCEIGTPKILPSSDAETDQAMDSTTGQEGVWRPIGNKRAKEEVKRAKLQDDILRMTAEAQQEQAAATKQMVRANFMRARTAENNSAIALLSMPTHTFPPELQAFMGEWKLEEAMLLKKRMRESAQEAASPEIQVSLPRINPLPIVRQPTFPIPARRENVEARTEDLLAEIDAEAEEAANVPGTFDEGEGGRSSTVAD